MRLLRAEGMTLEEISSKLGYSASTVHRTIVGKRHGTTHAQRKNTSIPSVFSLLSAEDLAFLDRESAACECSCIEYIAEIIRDARAEMEARRHAVSAAWKATAGSVSSGGRI
jgi:orotate phosphoribosyltransferase-like protein